MVSTIQRALAFVIVMAFFLPPVNGQRDIIRARVDLVLVPTSVRNSNGRFVYGLKQSDFEVYEDGRLQEIRSMSDEPARLSAAILIDTGTDISSLRRVAASIVSLSSAFTDSDEVEAYRFDHIVMKLSDFTSNHEEFEKKLRPVQSIAASAIGGHMNPLVILPGRGPKWLRWLLGDNSADFKNLNDPMFAAAKDLESRAADRRRLILIVSDGQVANDWSPLQRKSSTAFSFDQVRDHLVQHEIQVFGVSVGSGLLEGKMSILNAYAGATGGDVYYGMTQKAMESAFSNITEQSRHEYVLSYISNNEVPGLLPVTRKIQVKTIRPGLKVRHRESYLQYPAPR